MVGLLLLAPAVRLWRSRALEVVYTILGALCLASTLPGLVIALGGLSSNLTMSLDWFSYSMRWDSFGDGRLGNSFPSVHTPLMLVLLLHAASVLGRRAVARRGRTARPLAEKLQ